MPAPLANPIFAPNGTDFANNSAYLAAKWFSATNENTVLIEPIACSATLPAFLYEALKRKQKQQMKKQIEDNIWRKT